MGPPANDLCGGAILIGVPSLTTGTTVLATADVAPFCGTGDGTGGGVWYSVIGTGATLTATTCDAPANGCAGLASASYDTKIRVYTDGCAVLTCVTGNDDSCSGGTSGLRSTVMWSSVAGTEYLILVHGFGGASGTFDLEVCERPPPPANDDCSNASKVTNAEFPIDYDTSLATTDGLAHAACQFDGQTYNDIWYHYDSDFTGTVDIFTCGRADYDTDLVVYTGCSNDVPPGPCPPTDAELLDCNDDFPGCPGFTSFLKVPVVAGTCYTIRVGGFAAGDAGTGTLNLEKQSPLGACCLKDGTCVDPVDTITCDALGGTFQGGGSFCSLIPGDGGVICPPANNNCENRIKIQQGVPTDFDTSAATTDGLEIPPTCDFRFGGQQIHNDIWYNYNAGFTGAIEITTCEELGGAADFDTRLAAYLGCTTCPADDASLIDCNDDDPVNACGTGAGGFHSTLNIPVEAGNCYKIRVGGFSASQSGTGTILLTKRPLLGACCLKDGTCVDGVDTATCVALGGTFQGGGSVCSVIPGDGGVICPPANDNCENRIDILQDDPTPFDTTAASTDGVTTGICGQVNNDIWYNYNANFTGEIDITVCEELGGAADFDTKIAAYTGCDTAACPPDANIIDCNDDDPNNACGTFGGGFHSTLNIPVVAGECYKIRVGGFGAASAGTGTLLITKRLPPPGVFLDIKPGSCPNSFNPFSRGVLPVALVGTPDFDVKEVDISSLLLVRKDGLGGSIAPLEGLTGPHTVIDDAATPFSGDLQCDCHELEGDGIQDLKMKFRTPDLVAALELGFGDLGDLVSLTLIGNLLDGTPFEADDCIRLVQVFPGPPGPGGQ